MKIFVDVGSNIGQTIDALLEPSHGFDGIFCKYEFDRIHLCRARFEVPAEGFFSDPANRLTA